MIGDDRRQTVLFDAQKINLHQKGKEFEPKARAPKPGSGDFCLIAAAPIQEVVAHLDALGIEIEEGIVLGREPPERSSLSICVTRTAI